MTLFACIKKSELDPYGLYTRDDFFDFYELFLPSYEDELDVEEQLATSKMSYRDVERG